MKRSRTLAAVGILALCVSLIPMHARSQEQQSHAYFSVTGHHVPLIFVDAWWRFGGLPIIGYPVSEPFERDGMLVQHFERVVMEWHTQHAGTQYEVQMELLGDWTARHRQESAFQSLPENPLAPGEGFWFPETGHTLQSAFKIFWERYGGLQVFGYPISQQFEEHGRTVQYFERARFEWWPENGGTVYEVLLGHLGVEAARASVVSMDAVPRRDGVPEFDMRPPERALDLPILMYHRIGVPESRYQMSMWRFEQQLGWLGANGYTAVTLAQVYDYLYGFGQMPSRPVVLTFDDGWVSHWNAAAALERHGMRGVFFVTLDQPRMPDWQIRSLAERGHEIGGHTNTHPDLTAIGDARLWAEVAGNRQRLQDISGSPVDFFAYPYGAWDGRVIAAVESAGYRGAVAAWGGRGVRHDLRWTQPRVEVIGMVSIEDFIRQVR
jgi:peptidoglycan/xylan/chitin deacetylase (PgdA/CDA1 family)